MRMGIKISAVPINVIVAVTLGTGTNIFMDTLPARRFINYEVNLSSFLKSTST